MGCNCRNEQITTYIDNNKNNNNNNNKKNKKNEQQHYLLKINFMHHPHYRAQTCQLYNGSTDSMSIFGLDAFLMPPVTEVAISGNKLESLLQNFRHAILTEFHKICTISVGSTYE